MVEIASSHRTSPVGRSFEHTFLVVTADQCYRRRRKAAMNPSISVIIPTYNRHQMLIPVIESILAQTYPVDEVLVVDDGSQDRTMEEMQRCIEQRAGWHGKVRYIRQINQGQSAALNRGIREAKCEWLGFNGHDDLWLPWKLEWQFRAIEEHDPACSLCFTDAWFMNNPYMKGTLFQRYSGQLQGATGVLRNPVRIAINRDLPIWVQTVIARRDLVNHVGGFDPILRYSEDADFVFRMSLATSFCYVGMPMVLIDRSPADLRHQGESLNWHDVEFRLRMDRHLFEGQQALSAGLPADLRSRIRNNLRANQSHWATYYLGKGQIKEAREALRLACRHDPTPAIWIKRLITATAPQLAKAYFTMRDRHGGWRPDRASWKVAPSPSK